MRVSECIRSSGMMRLLALALLVLGAWSPASTAGAHERVVQEIVLIRHGIRAPTKSPEALAVYAAEPWPAWPVAPGQLTPHGARLMRSLGAWYRRDLAAAHIAPAGCDEHDVRLIADSTPRNRASAAAMTQGLRPGCPGRYDAFAAGHDDPLFRGRADESGDPPTPPTLPMAALTELQQVLLGCHDDACLARARAGGKRVLLGEKPAKALKQAGSLAENLMLAYVQGMPPAQVGWGRLDAAGVGSLATLHNASFAYAKQWPVAARGRGGNMLAHIGATLDAAAGKAGTIPSLAHAGERVVVLLGHDTDLASQAGLLGLDWHNAVQPDDYPPGGALIYRLVESNGRYTVRLRIALPTLEALRDGDVDAPHAMHVAPVRIPGCGDGWSCPLASFRKIMAKAVRPTDVVPGTGDEPAAH